MKEFKRSVFIMILLLFTIIFSSAFYFSVFSKTQTDLKKETFKYLLNEVIDISKNIENYNKGMGDFKTVLKNNPLIRTNYNNFLNTFITANLKNIFIVYKDKNSKFFKVLADGSKNPLDRFEFDEKFEPRFKNKWYEVLRNKKPIYFRNSIEGIWYTFLYPVIKDSKVVDYIIVIDFSTKPVLFIEKNLKSLRKLFMSYVAIIIWIIIVLAGFIFYDLRRENEMKKLLKKVQEFNLSLQKKVNEEVQKSREKDKQLILQSRLALMGELLSMIAHQWRQPLNVIAGVVNNMQLDLEFDEIDKKKLKEYNEKLKNTIKYLSQTIDDFRKFYREDKQKELCDVNELIEEVVNMIKPSINNKKIGLKLKLNCKKPVKVLKNEFKQVILNIIKNAEDILIEREIKNPYIIIKTFECDNKCVIEINDNGGGVALQIKDEIFKPYFTTKDEKNGTGLGLYMSKNIIEKRLNGVLSVYNNENGAVFRIELEVEDEYKRDQGNN